MKENNFQNKILNATKWSIITELAAKIAVPITSLILARILAPESFGVVANIVMLTSFVEIFSDAGFQKFVIQYEFDNKNEKFKMLNVAFWTNLCFSISLWIIIAALSSHIARVIGDISLSGAIIVSCLQLPINSLSSIQIALYKREFEFKRLFLLRMVTVFIPFIVSIPLALLKFDYWSIIISSLVASGLNSIIVFTFSKWRPKFFYNISILKKMFSFSIWTVIESVSIWLTVWVDAFIVSNIFNSYYLGLYKTSTTMVNSLMGIIVSATVPILFSTLSRLQNNEKLFNETFFKAQKVASMLIFPIGICIYLFSDMVTGFFLGKQWIDASSIVGVWSLTSAIMIVFGHYSSEVYRAKGRPKLSFIAQMLHLVVLIPVCIFSAKYGFWFFVTLRSWIRLEFVAVHLFLMGYVLKIPIKTMIKNVTPSVVCACLMGLFGLLLQKKLKFIDSSFTMLVLCITIYLFLMYFIPSTRKDMKILLSRFKNKFN